MSKEQVGKVIQVIGAVVDIAFDDDSNLPAIYNAIHVKDDNGSVPVDVVCETMQHLGDGVVRAVAMSSTDGMVRGMNGKVQEDVLIQINKSKSWLEENLKREGYLLEDIFYGFYRNKRLFLIRNENIK